MDTQDTRTRILDAAQVLVQQLGANAMSYQHLSDAVGIRKASIHYYFRSKSDLLAALIERYHDYFLGLVGGIQSGRGRGAAKLRAYWKLFEATLAETDCDRACPCGMLGAEIATLEPAAAAKLQAFYRANTIALAEILDSGRQDGSLQFPGAPEPLAWFIFSFLDGAMMVARVVGGVALFRSQVRVLETLLTD